MLFTPSDFSNGIKCLQKMCEMPQLHRHNYGIPQWNIFDPTHPRRNVESISAFPGWIRTRIGCVCGGECSMGVWVIVECLPSNAWGPGFHPRYRNKKKTEQGGGRREKDKGHGTECCPELVLLTFRLFFL